MRVKAWAHTSLSVRDLDQAIGFYRAVFGYEVKFRENAMAEGPEAITGIPGLRCDLAQLRSPISDHILELIRWHGHVDVQVAEPETPLKPGQAHVAFLVDNLDAALAKVESLGAKRLGGLFVLPGYRSVYVREPSGSFIELEETNET